LKLITRIASLRHPGVLRDFTWPSDLPTFARFNLIYGWNGSGKTTISTFLRALELKTRPTLGEVTLSLQDTDVHSDEFSTTTLSVRVFNRDFVSENVFPIDGGDIPPIYIIGKESVEKQKEINRLKSDLAAVEADLDKAKSSKRIADRALDQFCVSKADNIRSNLRSAGSNRYNNYDKSTFRARANKMVRDGDETTCLLDYEMHDKSNAQLRSSPKPQIDEISCDLPDLYAHTDVVSAILDRVVGATVIESLKADPELSSWVHKGVTLHRSHDVHKCLFCEQTLPLNRLTALSAHFSEDFEKLMKDIATEIESLQATLRATTDLAFPYRAELHEYLASEYSKAQTAAQEVLEGVKTYLSSLEQALTIKTRRPFEKCPLSNNLPVVVPGIIDNLNDVIRKHNNACIAFDTRTIEARERLENHFVACALADFQTFSKEAQEQEKSVAHFTNETDRLRDEIQKLESDLRQHQQPADELNDDLRIYLGHKELILEVKGTGYAITREGNPAISLSEGEKTALALLYFLKCLQDHRLNLGECVVVLDDPVSSLDANAIYLAFGFIRDRTQGAGQLFVLTHNFTFFRQVKNWFQVLNKNRDRKPARFYMLERVLRSPYRCCTIRRLDRLLEDYESEYHYLFTRIHQEAQSSESITLEHCYALPNMARRLLEGFLAFRQPHVGGQLWQKLKDISFEEAKKHRMIRFLHTHSHADAIQEPEHDLALLGEARSVLCDLMELIQTLDPEHFNSMRRLACPEEGTVEPS
jgi:wobble nucleotide-excising tRNase